MLGIVKESSWRRKRRFAPFLSAVLPGLGQAFTGRWGSALSFFFLGATPPFFMGYIWRNTEAGGWSWGDLAGAIPPIFFRGIFTSTPEATAYFHWREPNTGHYIMLGFLGLTWAINIWDAFRGTPAPTAPCIEACPAHIQIPHYINLILEKRYEDCHTLITRYTPLVGVIGHVCHHPCEGKCTRHAFDEAVAICPLKAFVGNYMISNNLLKDLPAPSLYQKAPKVAVIGSGPAGLSAAFFMTRLGLSPTIFEALPVAGGMLAVGIPAYRLPRHILQAELDYIQSQGVTMRTGTAVGREVAIEELFADGFRAVFAAPGTHREAKLRVEGEEKEGVVPGLSFLRSVNLGERRALEGAVVVVGGGNVAMDAARCALRLGAPQVTVVYRRSRLEMPANEWEVREAEEEGVRFLFLTNPVKVLGGAVTEGAQCLEMRLGEPDKSGRRKPIPVEGSEFTIPCRHLIPAIGLSPDTSFLEKAGVKLDSGGLILTRRGSLSTYTKGFFAGGDAVTGPASVIEASQQGREAAIQIFSYLSGRPAFSDRRLRIGRAQSDFGTRVRVSQERRGAEERIRDFRLIHQVYAEEASFSEGRRCLRCDLGM